MTRANNLDNNKLNKGTDVLLPVFVPCALFSTRDGHFADSDGQVFITGVKTAATVTVEFALRKGETARQNINSVQLQHHVAPSPFTESRQFLLYDRDANHERRTGRIGEFEPGCQECFAKHNRLSYEIERLYKRAGLYHLWSCFRFSD